MLYYKTQEDVARVLIDVIDDYWNMVIDDDTLIKMIREITQNNIRLVFKGDYYSPVIIQRLGARRLDLMHKILIV